MLTLVLYSRKGSATRGVWKVADFGLTVEATSKQLHTTRSSKGTSSYRAPELVREHGPGTFNNKVDIWALGCIIFEIVFRKKAFSSDFAVYQYAGTNGECFKIPDTTAMSIDLTLVSEVIKDLLAIDPSDRPSAQALVKVLKR